MSSSLETEYELSPEGAIRSVEEVAEAGAIYVVLNVARIEVIKNVVNANPYLETAFLAVKRQSQRFERLNIKGIESAEALVIARTDKLAGLIYD